MHSSKNFNCSIQGEITVQSAKPLYHKTPLFITCFQVSGERKSTNMWFEILISWVNKAFKVKNHPYLTVSNTIKDCWYVVSHVSSASSNYESRFWSRSCFDFRQKPVRSLFQVHAVNDTWVTGAYLWCGRSLACHHNYFVGKMFISANTDRYKKNYRPWLMWKLIVSAVS